MTTKNKARFAGFMAAAALLVGAGSASAQSSSAELQAQINALMAQLAALQGATVSTTFTMDLTVGSTGPQVVALQTFLESKGYLVMPVGVAKGYFGGLTRAALARFQAANGIAPAVGYFGPITRARINGMIVVTPGGPVIVVPGTPGTPSGLQGGEGSLIEFSQLGDVESAVDEGDNNVKVLGVEFEADNSDLSVQRVDVTLNISAGTSNRVEDYISTLSLWMDGKKLATMDADEGSENTNDIFTYRFAGLNGIVREDAKAKLYVAVDAVESIDSTESGDDIVASIPVNGIRAVDAAGISETYDTVAFTDTFDVNTETGGDLDIVEASNNPKTGNVQINETNDTDNVLVLAFDIDADNQDLTIEAIPVGFVVTENDGVDGPVKNVVLKRNGTTISTESIPAAAGTSYQVLFDNLGLSLNDGDTDKFTVYVNLNDADISTFATTTTLYATTTGSSTWDVEDTNGDNVTPSGSVTGGTLTFLTEGISGSLTSSSAEAALNLDTTSTDDQGKFTMNFTVTAFEVASWIELEAASSTSANASDVGVAYFIENASTGASVATGTNTATLARVSGGTMDGNFVKINAGQTATFTLTVYHDAAATGIYRVQLDSVGYNQTSAAQANAEYDTVPAEDFQSANVQVQN